MKKKKNGERTRIRMKKAVRNEVTCKQGRIFFLIRKKRKDNFFLF